AYDLRTNGLQTAPAGTLEDSVQLARNEITNHLIAAHPELFWVHAGAAALEAGAVLVVGTWGHGKSTMVTSLCSRGWSYLSDDVVALDTKARLAVPFHQTPLVREDPGHDLPRERILELYKTEIDLGRVSICRRPVPIAAVLLPTFARHAPAQLLRISPAAAALELLQSCMNFGQHRAAGVGFVCEFVESVPAFRLTFGSGEAAAELVSEAHACGYSV
ncbi:MAG TPA: hypothetical protein VGR27_03565, partial [Longimicrobiaceae bacterium]|nr:hypothetical protein [Longimicrobiaceae bacterium]